MNDQTINRAHWSFWIIDFVALAYNLAGVMNFVTQMNPENVAAMPDMYRALIESRPAWATGAFAVAVFGGTIGCVLLMAKKSVAYSVFVVSLLGAIVTLIHALGLGGTGANPMDFVVGNLIQLGVTIFLIWYARWTLGKGWIG
jgi:hypothetical protein